MTTDNTPEPVAPGSTPLGNKRREQFAQLVARSVSFAEAFRQCSPRAITDGTAASNGYRWSKRVDIIDRVQWLRGEAIRRQTEAPEELSKSEILDLMGEVTEAFQAAICEAELARVSPKFIASLRSDLVIHVNRLHRQPEPPERPKLGDEDHVGDGLRRLPLCTCGVHQS